MKPVNLNVRETVRPLIAALTIALFSVFASGCGSPGSSDLPASPTNQNFPADTEEGEGFPSDLAGVVWLHSDVSDWPATANLRSVNVSGGTISLDYDRANVWPAINHAGASVNANPWVFVNEGGTWYAGTFEWFRRGQTSKPVAVVAGDHIKASPLNRFRPRSGEQYGFMVSGLARDRARNVRERTQVVMFTWP